jgi:hypothetical protein
MCVCVCVWKKERAKATWALKTFSFLLNAVQVIFKLIKDEMTINIIRMTSHKFGATPSFIMSQFLNPYQ